MQKILVLVVCSLFILASGSPFGGAQKFLGKDVLEQLGLQSENGDFTINERDTIVQKRQVANECPTIVCLGVNQPCHVSNSTSDCMRCRDAFLQCLTAGVTAANASATCNCFSQGRTCARAANASEHCEGWDAIFGDVCGDLFPQVFPNDTCSCPTALNLTYVTCGFNLWCDETGRGCSAQKTSGRCTFDQECGDPRLGFGTEGSYGCTGGNCTKKPKFARVNDGCSSTSDCDGNHTSCNTTSGLCQGSKLGQPCDIVEDCNWGLYCNGSQCLTAIPLGQNCTFPEINGKKVNPCYLNSTCGAEGTCIRLYSKNNNQTCVIGETNECTYGSYCGADGRCAPFPYNGVSCVDSAECAPYQINATCDCAFPLSPGKLCNLDDTSSTPSACQVPFQDIVDCYLSQQCLQLSFDSASCAMKHCYNASYCFIDCIYSNSPFLQALMRTNCATPVVLPPFTCPSHTVPTTGSATSAGTSTNPTTASSASTTTASSASTTADSEGSVGSVARITSWVLMASAFFLFTH